MIIYTPTTHVCFWMAIKVPGKIPTFIVTNKKSDITHLSQKKRFSF